jgi:hypothetical protein
MNIKYLFRVIQTINEPRHDKTNIVQSDQDPCCSLTNPITSRDTDSEQHG